MILFLSVAGALFYHQVLMGGYYQRLSLHNRIRVVPLEGPRGKIFDRQGVVLADNRLSYNLAVLPQDIQNREELFGFLAEITLKTSRYLEGIYNKKKMAPFEPAVILENVGLDIVVKAEENRFRFPSLLIQKTYRREYPYQKSGAHVLGYVGQITAERMRRYKEYGYAPGRFTGFSGVEEYYDSYLKSGEGGLQIEVNSRGQQVRLLGFKEPVRGADIFLTIDARMQDIAREALENYRGSVVIMNARNGEILTMQNSPSFDPNVLVDPARDNEKNVLFRSSTSPLLNRAISGRYPPGSVFKVPMAIFGLYSHKITAGTTFFCKGFLELGNIRFGCTHAHGEENLIEALAHSCNVYFYHLGKLLGVDLISRYARWFGFGSLTHIDLPHENAGFLPTRRHRRISGNGWFTGDTYNLSIGQGDLLSTPLQITRMMAAVAMDGYIVQPHVIRSIDAAAYGHVAQRQIDIDRRIYSEVKRGMRAAVADYAGTANTVNIPGVFIAGKTGTAQAGGGQDHHAWFSGYLETAGETWAFCILLENGGSSQNACLVARQIFLKMQEEKLL